MPKIRQIKNYSIPKYPRGIYYPKPDSAAIAYGKGAMATALITLLFEACGDGGQTGPPPVPPELVTESEARVVIDQVFADNNIELAHDVPKFFGHPPGDSTELNLDGYNDSLDVGYEYISGQDHDVFTWGMVQALDSASQDAGPYIKALYEIVQGPNSDSLLESIMQEFLDSLKAQGVI
jgi:hypothetical protein